MHKHIHPRKAEGKIISRVLLAHQTWRSVKSGSRVPDSKHLFNFSLKFGDHELLVLDNYGNELLPNEMEKRLLHLDKFEYTLAIDVKTGLVYSVTFGIEKRKHLAIICPFMYDEHEQAEVYRIPEKFLPGIPTLKNQKRPFAVSVDPAAVLAFVDREQGYDWLRKAIQVQFHFEPNRLEVDAHFYRVVGDWT